MFLLKNVTYGNILEIQELYIPPGKVTCITGESGSGKSTLVKLLNNIISADRGTITYQGTPVEQTDPVELRRKVVMVPQTPPVFGGTVKDNLVAGLEFSGHPPAEDSLLTEVLKTVCLEKKLDESADQLSGGEKQRLALGVALLLEPEVYILDEPTSGLDETTERKVIENIYRNISGRGKMLLMITHSKAVAEEYGEIVVEMADGKVAGVKERHR
ncbi:ABC transporter ATP-binding protein [Evansella clarkii]|jgi:putative ABC transport system ATP-binding protein|uniref:ABC transporter ATP-binding protein n=1 Tax=Evansella clarkii TaxID=79879 RepID=UPI0009968D2D|nr:ABC transporter ATP-binding protein [Evansella clarkii]